jgi:hypothetical protein
VLLELQPRLLGGAVSELACNKICELVEATAVSVSVCRPSRTKTSFEELWRSVHVCVLGWVFGGI